MTRCKFAAKSKLPIEFGDFEICAFEEDSGKEHIALVLGKIENQENVFCRVHSECLTGDTFFSKKCDCGHQLRRSMELISEKGSGIILYLRQEGRGIGLVNKIKAYSLQDEGYDTVEANEMLGFNADERSYEIRSDMLSHFSIKSVNVLTNNPNKVKGLEESNISVSKRIPLHVGKNQVNSAYLKTKKDKLGHLD